jgi:hypothetical protein
LSAGMDYFLVKPLDRERLRQILDAIPTHSRLQLPRSAPLPTLS